MAAKTGWEVVAHDAGKALSTLAIIVDENGDYSPKSRFRRLDSREFGDHGIVARVDRA